MHVPTLQLIKGHIKVDLFHNSYVELTNIFRLYSPAVTVCMCVYIYTKNGFRYLNSSKCQCPKLLSEGISRPVVCTIAVQEHSHRTR